MDSHLVPNPFEVILIAAAEIQATMSKTKKPPCRYYSVNVAIRLDRRGQFAIVHKSRTKRHSWPSGKSFALSRQLGDNLASNLAFTLDFNDADGHLGLHKQIYLDTSTSRFRRCSTSERRSRQDERPVHVQRRQKLSVIVDHQILKSQSHDRIPFRELVEGVERIRTFVYNPYSWAYAFQIGIAAIMPYLAVLRL